MKSAAVKWGLVGNDGLGDGVGRKGREKRGVKGARGEAKQERFLAATILR